MLLNPQLVLAPPTLSDAQVAGLALRHFGVTGTLQRLTSERDLNIRITTPTARYVLKLANSAEAADLTDFQTQALLHLEGKSLPVPRVICTVLGETAAITPHGTLRLLTYLVGTPQHVTAKTAAQSRNLARMAARLSGALQTFTHPAAHHHLQWDIKNASHLRPLLAAIPDPNLRDLATQTLNRFDADIAPGLAQLRAQVVHNDLNPHNVLTDPANPDVITGILDFGDMVHTPLICDVAITASYLIDPAHPLASLITFAAAYHAALPLTKTEVALLPDLIATRMITTLAITSARAAAFPQNAPYILRNYALARDGLCALLAVNRTVLHSALKTELP